MNYLINQYHYFIHINCSFFLHITDKTLQRKMKRFEKSKVYQNRHKICSRMLANKFFFFFLKEDFIRKSTKTTLLTKYIHICTFHHQLHLQTLHIIQNEVLTMDIKHLSNRQLSRKVVQLIYVGCPRIMQIYLVYTLELVWDYKTIVWNAGQISY